MLTTATSDHEGLALWAKLLFIAIGIGLFMPAIYNVVKGTTFQQRRYDRTRNSKVKPIGEARLRHMWVVDRERTNDDAGVTVYVRKDPKK